MEKLFYGSEYDWSDNFVSPACGFPVYAGEIKIFKGRYSGYLGDIMYMLSNRYSSAEGVSSGFVGGQRVSYHHSAVFRVLCVAIRRKHSSDGVFVFSIFFHLSGNLHFFGIYCSFILERPEFAYIDDYPACLADWRDFPLSPLGEGTI